MRNDYFNVTEFRLRGWEREQIERRQVPSFESTHRRIEMADSNFIDFVLNSARRQSFCSVKTSDVFDFFSGFHINVLFD